MGVADLQKLGETLRYYKRPEVQQALVRHTQDREVSVRYGADQFGKRPDVLNYPADVLSFAQQKVTSFHCSEERWRDPLSIVTGMSRKQLDELRIGWDLVLDIDCPFWEYSKLTTHLFIKALQDHGIQSVSCKFSGNKGFHIGVPFEAFPKEIEEKETKTLFPEAPRAIAEYLLNYIEQEYITVKDNVISFGDEHTISFSKLQEKLEGVELLQNVCAECKKTRKEAVQETTALKKFVCPNCAEEAKSSQQIVKCSCGMLMQEVTQGTTDSCPHCSSKLPPIKQFNMTSIIEVDTILLASRHLFRTAYSLHEKSGLVSVPIDANTVLTFEKTAAQKDKADYSLTFLERKASNEEGRELLTKALLFTSVREAKEEAQRKDYEAPEEAVPEEYFPPCIQGILRGLMDGKKRALFILTNFFYSLGWSSEMIKDAIYEWNERNPEKIREVNVKGHLSLKAKKKEIVLPPNCTSDYYKGLQVCKPDDFCKTIKNPAQYALKKYRQANFRKDGAKKAKREKLTEEQKAMRRAYKEKLKAEKEKDAQELKSPETDE